MLAWRNNQITLIVFPTESCLFSQIFHHISAIAKNDFPFLLTLTNSMLPLRKVSKPYIVLYWKICRNWILKAPNLKTFFITSTNFVSGKWSPGKICVFEQNLGHYTPFTGDPWWVNSPFCVVCFQADCCMVWSGLKGGSKKNDLKWWRW